MSIITFENRDGGYRSVVQCDSDTPCANIRNFIDHDTQFHGMAIIALNLDAYKRYVGIVTVVGDDGVERVYCPEHAPK